VNLAFYFKITRSDMRYIYETVDNANYSSTQ